MRPLSPAERTAILAEHPGMSEADLDRLEELAARSFYGTAGEDDEERARVGRELEELQARFPRLEEAVAQVRGEPA